MTQSEQDHRRSELCFISGLALQKNLAFAKCCSKLFVKPISNNALTGSLPTHCHANVSKRTDTISWAVRVRTPPLTSPKSILFDKSYLTCGDGRERTDLRNHCPVVQEAVAEWDVLKKDKEVQREGVVGFWTWKMQPWEFVDSKNITYAMSKWTLWR